jgi:hypothetical protein
MMRFNLKTAAALVAVATIVVCASSAGAVPFQIGFATGTNTNHLFAQGFSPSVRANPDPFTDPMIEDLETLVPLDRFRFFKSNYFFEDPPGSGTFVPLVATNFQLAIVNNYFLDLSTFTTSSPELEGLSTNTIATTEPLASGAPMDFLFDSLELTYGLDYAAIFVSNDGAGNLSIVDVPAMIVNYVEDPPGTFAPNVDYGDPDLDFVYSASNFRTGNFLTTFNPPFGDASFVAFFDEEVPMGLPGDFNGDNVVDAVDYTVWRNNFGDLDETNINNNGDGGDVGTTDYDLWKLSYGDTGPGAGGGGIGAAPVPEPSSFAFAAISVGLLLSGAIGRVGR